jgi:hypothetical protein
MNLFVDTINTTIKNNFIKLLKSRGFTVNTQNAGNFIAIIIGDKTAKIYDTILRCDNTWYESVSLNKTYEEIRKLPRMEQYKFGNTYITIFDKFIKIGPYKLDIDNIKSLVKYLEEKE